jgi:hypothetical protein
MAQFSSIKQKSMVAGHTQLRHTMQIITPQALLAGASSSAEAAAASLVAASGTVASAEEINDK